MGKYAALCPLSSLPKGLMEVAAGLGYAAGPPIGGALYQVCMPVCLISGRVYAYIRWGVCLTSGGVYAYIRWGVCLTSGGVYACVPYIIGFKI